MEGIQGRQSGDSVRLRLLGQGIGADFEGEWSKSLARVHLNHRGREVPDHRHRVHLHPPRLYRPHVEGNAKQPVRLGAVTFRPLDVVGDGARLVRGHPEGAQRSVGEVMHFLQAESYFVTHVLPSRVPGFGISFGCDGSCNLLRYADMGFREYGNPRKSKGLGKFRASLNPCRRPKGVRKDGNRTCLAKPELQGVVNPKTLSARRFAAHA